MNIWFVWLKGQIEKPMTSDPGSHVIWWVSTIALSNMMLMILLLILPTEEAKRIMAVFIVMLNICYPAAAIAWIWDKNKRSKKNAASTTKE